MIARVRQKSRSQHDRRLRFDAPKLRLTAEGWYYLLVVAFIIGGAVLREVNLLVLLGGMMIGPFLWNWLLARWALQEVEATPLPVPRVHAGDRVSVSWLLHHDSAKLPAWGVLLEEGLHRPGTRGRARARVAVPVLDGRRAVRAGYQLTLPERGAYELGPVRLSTSFPLGLIRSATVLAHRREAIVWPRLGRLTPAWHQLLRRAQQGQQTSQPRKGRVEGDYYGLREWRPGDSRRWIHWRTSARLNQLTVKQFEQRREESLALVVDLWIPEAATEADQDAVEQALRFVATVIEDRRKRGEHEIRLVLQETERHDWRGVVRGSLAAQVLDTLAAAKAAPWDTATPVDTLWEGFDLRNRQLIVVSTRERPASVPAPSEAYDILWIGPSDYDRWYHDVDDEDRTNARSAQHIEGAQHTSDGAKRAAAAVEEVVE